MPLSKAIFESVIQKQVGLPAKIETAAHPYRAYILGQTLVVNAGQQHFRLSCIMIYAYGKTRRAAD